jgi:signal transduction histidine kinase
MLPNERTTRSEVVTLPEEVEALIAAPSRSLARPMVEFLKREGINVQLVVNADSAFEEALLHRPSVVLIDDRIPPEGGIELCQRLKGNTRTHFVPAILYAQSDVRQHRLRALAAGADAIFGPNTDDQERRTRLWALLRTQSIYRRQEKKQRRQGSAIQDRRRWVGGFVHDLQSSIGALQANFDYLAQAARSKSRLTSTDLDECVHDTQTVFRQIARGLRTVLDYERFEAGRIGLKEVPLLLGELAREVKSELDWQASTTGKALELERQPREAAVRGDPDHLKEALVNLVGFVLRQPGNRRVVVKVWSAGGVTRLSVGGDGDRIPPEDREKIFEPYARASKQAPVGHGLGLALAKVVLDLHGGNIWVDDVPRGGSAFVLELKSEGGTPRLRTVG